MADVEQTPATRPTPSVVVAETHSAETHGVVDGGERNHILPGIYFQPSRNSVFVTRFTPQDKLKDLQRQAEAFDLELCMEEFVSGEYDEDGSDGEGPFDYQSERKMLRPPTLLEVYDVAKGRSDLFGATNAVHELDLASTHFGDGDVPALGKLLELLPNCKYVDLRSTQLSEAGLDDLAALAAKHNYSVVFHVAMTFAIWFHSQSMHKHLSRDERELVCLPVLPRRDMRDVRSICKAAFSIADCVGEVGPDSRAGQFTLDKLPSESLTAKALRCACKSFPSFGLLAAELSRSKLEQ